MSETALADAGFAYDPFSFEVMRNPLPFYKVLRDRYPAYYLEQYDAFAFSRFADVATLFENPNSFHTQEGTLVDKTAISNRHRGLPPPQNYTPLPLLGGIQPPWYENTRQAMGALLRPHSVAAIEDDVRARTRALLDKLVPRGRFDVVIDLAGVVAAGSVCRLCGIPVERAAEVLDAANAASAQDPETGGFPPDWMKNRERLLEICREAVRARKSDPAPQGATAVDGLLRYKFQGRDLEVNEIATLISSIVFGGTETLPKVVAHGLMELEKAPAQKQAVMADLRANPTAAFEEMLRYCAPAQWFMRTVKTPITIAGAMLEPGQRVLALVASANRDERQFPEPDQFIWNRKITKHMGFGQGLHFCIGAHLARLEGRVLLQEVLSRLPNYRITDARRTPSSFQWGYTRATMHAN